MPGNAESYWQNIFGRLTIQYFQLIICRTLRPKIALTLFKDVPLWTRLNFEKR